RPIPRSKSFKHIFHDLNVRIAHDHVPSLDDRQPTAFLQRAKATSLPVNSDAILLRRHVFVP
ncbi:uncharacterized protein METZ01_LOCUS150831, partial [marine metagenome]